MTEFSSPAAACWAGSSLTSGQLVNWVVALRGRSRPRPPPASSTRPYRASWRRWNEQLPELSPSRAAAWVAVIGPSRRSRPTREMRSGWARARRARGLVSRVTSRPGYQSSLMNAKITLQRTLCKGFFGKMGGPPRGRASWESAGRWGGRPSWSGLISAARGAGLARTLRVSSRNARFQEWQALLGNRRKRRQAGAFVVQGVRPITLAMEHGWPVRTLIYDADRRLSRWASSVLESPAAAGAERVAMSGELVAELGEKDQDAPELVAVVAMPADDLGRIRVTEGFLGLAFDRPHSPGNVGSIVRSADAFGAAGGIVTGHAADPYDPRGVRASTGSLLAVPVVRTEGPAEVARGARAQRAAGVPVAVVGTDEHGQTDVAAHDLTGPTLVVIGNETSGLSEAWRSACDTIVRIPISGSASSLNAASAATVLLYEAARQRA